MLKVADYFCFIPALFTGAGALCFGTLITGKFSRHRGAAIVILAAAAILIPYVGLAYERKLKMLERYKNNVSSVPSVSAYALPQRNGASTVAPDFGPDGPFNLFIYCNRWGTTQIVFPAEAATRFARATENSPPADHIFRLGGLPAPGESFMDINRPLESTAPQSCELMPNRGFLQLSNLNSSPSWLGPEGERPDTLFRWLAGNSGAFYIYRSPQGPSPRFINVRLALGPDARAETIVRVAVDGRDVGEVSGADLLDGSRSYRFAIPAFESLSVLGSIRIEDPKTSIHRLKVLRLFVD